jgi:uncharacterized repeat protein (TIGR02059 family)
LTWNKAIIIDGGYERMTVLDYSNPNGLRRALTRWCRKWSGSAYTPPERGAATRAMGAAAVVSMLTAILLATPATAQAQPTLTITGGNNIAISVNENIGITTDDIFYHFGASGGIGARVWKIQGPDSHRFMLVEGTGDLHFVVSPDYESPIDSDRNNVYEFTVRVTVGSASDEAEVKVTVKDVDEVAPKLTRATVSGKTVVLTYDKDVKLAAGAAFTVNVGGTPDVETSAKAIGRTVTLTLMAAVRNNVVVTLNYGDTAVEDKAGNNAAGVTDRSVTNLNPGPRFRSGTVSGTRIVLTYNKALQRFSVPMVGAFAVMVGTAERTVEHVGVTGTTLILNLDGRPVTEKEKVTVAYMAAGALRDSEDNEAGTLAVQALRNLTVSPRLLTATVNDDKLVLTYNMELDEDSAPTTTALGEIGFAGFAVSVGGEPNPVSGATVEGSTVTLMLELVVSPDAGTVKVTYAVPAMDPIQDAAGRGSAAAFEDQVATTLSKAPVLTGITLDGNQLVLTYSEALNGASAPNPAAFKVTVAGVPNPVTTVAVSKSTVILTLTSKVDSGGGVVKVSYTPGETPIQDAGGLDAAAFSNMEVGNVTAAPRFISATVKGATLEMTYSEALDGNSVPDPDDFTVMVAGAARGVDSVAVSGPTVTLTLSSAVMFDEAVTVSYRPGIFKLREKSAAKAEATALSATAVTNNTPSLTPPMLTSAIVDGDTLTLTYGEALDEESVPASTDFTVMVGSDPSRAITGVAVKESAVTLTLATRVRGDEVVTVSYSPGTNKIQDMEGNPDPGWVDKAAENITDDPMFTSAIVDGDTLTLTYGEALDEDSVPASSDFTVMVASDPDRGISNVAVSGSAVTLTLASAVLKSEMVMVSYTPGTNKIQDAAGNPAAALNKMAVHNSTAPPALMTTDAATVKGDKIVLSYDQDLDAGSQPAATDFTVMVAGEARMVSSAVVSGSMVTLTLASAVMPGDAVMVSYTPGTNPIQDMAGDPAPAIADMAVMNKTIVETPPKFSGATVDGATLVLTYDEALDEESVPAPSDYVVKAGSQMAPVSSVAVSGSMVTLMLAARVLADEFVTVSYTAGDNPVQDLEGTPDPGWPAQNVDNITAPPMLTEATVDGDILTLMYDEDLDEESVPAASDFNVMVGSNQRRVMVSPDGVAISGSMVTLMLAEAVRVIDPVTLSYTPGTNRIQDPAGNTAAAISNMTVRNSSVSPVGTESFEITDRGGVSITSSGTGGAMRVGYARIRADAGSTTPAGVAIFAFRDSEGVLISEAGVPATETVMEGRIFAEVYGTVNTGLAIANPNDDPATIDFYFTDTSGTSFRSGSVQLGANQQMAKFLNQDPFAGSLPQGGDGVMGTFTFESSAPIAVTALRGLANEAGEFLMTTLPVAPLSSASTGMAYFPHFADGGGWATQIILVNPTNSRLTGTIGFLGTGQAALAAAPVSLTLDGETGSSFDYSIAPNSSQRFTTSNPAGTPSVGSVRVAPSEGTITPSGLVIFSFVQDGKIVSEAAVAAMTAGRAFRAYAEMSGDAGEAGAVRTGLAITNATDTFNYVSLEIMNLDGTRAADTETILIPPSGQYAKFLDEIFDSLAGTFSGVLRIEGSAEVAVVGLRLRQNAMGELKMTTIPPSNEMDAATSDDRFFAHFVDSAGWSTQFILYTGTPGQAASGTLSLIGQSGQPLELTTQQ